MTTLMMEAEERRPAPPFDGDPGFARLLRGVQAWHLFLAGIATWVLVNVAGGFWALGSIERTSLGVAGAVGLGLNLLAVVLLARRVRAGRTLSFVISVLVAIGAFVVVFVQLQIAEGLDVFAGAFQRAFPALILVFVGVIWYVVARRIHRRVLPPGALVTDEAVSAGAVRAAQWLMWAGLAIIAVGGVWWLVLMRADRALQYFWDAIRSDPVAFLAGLVVLLMAGWALRTIISDRSARFFEVENAEAEALAGWLYLSPNLLGFLAFFAGPLVFSMAISFYDWDGVTEAVFVGVDNYVETLSLSVAGSAAGLPAGYTEIIGVPFSDSVIGASDPLFWKSMANIFILLFIAVPAAVLSALFLAVMINAGYRGTKTFRTVFFVPAVAGVIGVTLIWKQMFNAAVGFINWGITTGGQAINTILPGDPFPDRVEIGWLSDPSVALLAVCIVFVWSQFGFNTVLFTAGLQGIGRDLYEAAELDGCNAWQQFRNVTVPQLKETTFFVTVTTVILVLQLFDIVYALNQPNPVGYPDNATLTPVVYIYQLGFQQDSFGQASAVAWVLFVIIFVFTLAQFRMQRAEAEVK
ncbi:MAG: sugar ABC transporter permease [Candidatus Nanopelagicales bacterium]|nr:sugar ABC transporter permease [Candidatus Nanopelagicales bacterium]